MALGDLYGQFQRNVDMTVLGPYVSQKFNYDYHIYWGKGFLWNPTFTPLCKESPEI